MVGADAGSGGSGDAVALAQRVELLLGRIDALPTLSPVAVAVLECSSDPDADLDRVAKLIGSDPAMRDRKSVV